jgi:membrane fusion protein (multidrug efflux system)
VRATFDNKDNLLTDGQTVRVILEDSKPQTVVAIPQQAVALDQTGPYLFVVDDKNVVHLRRIKAGIVRNGQLVVTEGLKSGEKVVIQGQQRIRDGMTVAPSQAPDRPKQ